MQFNFEFELSRSYERCSLDFCRSGPLNQKMEQSASNHWNVCVTSAFNSIIITALCAAIALFLAMCNITSWS